MSLPAGITVRWTPIPAGTARRDVAWQLLRTIVGDPTAAITNTCPFCGGPHGPVWFADRDTLGSVSYAGGFAVVAVADAATARAVGVDAESVSHPRRTTEDMRGIIHPGRSSSLREWTRVEAVLKADGRGLRVAPATLSITEGEGAWRASVGDSDRRYTGWEVIGPPGVLASVAVEPVSAAADTAAAGALDR